jgi:hypothetical protein
MPPPTQGPPAPTVRSVLDSLNVSGAGRRAQVEAVAEAAYAGRLSLDALRVMRAAGFLPYDVDRPEEEH